MIRHALAAVFLFALALPAAAQAPCTLAQAGVKTRVSGAVSDWWPKTTTQPTGGTVQVGGGRQIPLLVVKPKPANIKAGVAPDALAFCLPLATLARGDTLAFSMTIAGEPVAVVTCRFETGDLYNVRNYGTPAKKLATIEPRILAAGAATGACAAEIGIAEPPPVVVPPPTQPPPAAGSWMQIAAEHGRINLPTGTRVRFGAGASWVEKSLEFSGELCNAEQFGSDPLPGGEKVCQAWQQ